MIAAPLLGTRRDERRLVVHLPAGRGGATAARGALGPRRPGAPGAGRATAPPRGGGFRRPLSHRQREVSASASRARRGPGWSVLALLHLSRLAAVAGSHFCGTNWNDANGNCWEACPSELDSECTQPGHACFPYTGCAVAAEESVGGDGDDDDEDFAGMESDSTCGKTWMLATSCSKRCPLGTECTGNETCFAATNCNKPMEPTLSKMLMRLLGDFPGSVEMGYDAQVVFSEAIVDHLATSLEESHVSINGAEVTGQTLSFRNKGGRRTTLASSLDVSMSIKGEYRPPPYQNVNKLVEDSINAASQRLLEDVRDRGRRAGTPLFESVEGLEAEREADTTPPPTRYPTSRPTTGTPTPQPIHPPSSSPLRSPSAAPTAAPTRAWVQAAQTAAGAALYEGTSKSYGVLFEVQTQPDAETLLVQGLDFYADVVGEVSYEVLSKEGGWQGFEGDAENFTKIAEGAAYSPGKCSRESEDCDSHFTTIPFEEIDQVAIRGGGGSRSFYITLMTRDILYSLSESSNITAQMETPGELQTVAQFHYYCCTPTVRQMTPLLSHLFRPVGVRGGGRDMVSIQ